MKTEAKHDTPVMADGTIEFVVRSADGSEHSHRVDLLEVKILCEQCEEQHNLAPADGGVMRPTVAFLRDLASRLQSELGMDGVTSSVAWQVWCATAAQMQELKKTPAETPK